MGELFVYGNSSLKMASGETNIGHNNSRIRRLSNDFCTCIPII